MKVSKLLIGKKIQMIRVSHNMRQVDFCKKIKISQAALSRIESGQNYPSLDSLLNIHNIFNISFEKIIIGSLSEFKKNWVTHTKE